MIYLDNAATTLYKPPRVVEAVADALQNFGNDGRGTHGGNLCASRAIYEARVSLAELFGCPRPDHVVFTSNSTEALNIAIHGALDAGGHVLSTDLEHNSVLRPLYRMEAQGLAVSFLPADRRGNIDYDDLGRLLRPDTKAVVCTHASNLTGNLLDLRRIGAFAGERGLLFIVDASQTAGAYPIDMERMHIDILCFTGHKSLMGPQGTGGLCIREDLPLRFWKVGGSGVHSYAREQPPELPTRLEAGTLNGHGIAGLLAAVEYIREQGVETIHQKETELMRRFYSGVSAIDGVTVYGDFETGDRMPIVTLNIRDCASSEVSDALSESYGIATRPGAHCAPRMHDALGTKEQGAVRFSFGWFNTEEEVDWAVRALKELAEE
jgi:cysteine desulfurase family protein